MTTKISTNNLDTTVTTLVAGYGGPKISNIAVTDSSYTVLDDTAVSTAGGNIQITGTNFVTGCQVLINTTAATSVTFVNSTTVRAQVPATGAGTYVVYLVNPDGGVAIRVNGISFGTSPTWSTGSTLAGAVVGAAISIQLSATSDSTVTYSLAAGSSLPPGVTLSSSGLLSGTVTGLTSDTTYNFSIVATDVELQDVTRAFSITITAGDANFNQTSLLLNADVSPFNADASTNNFAISVSGDTKPNNFGPYTPGYYSNYFDGSGDYIVSPSSANLSPGTGDFTLECWVYFTAAGNDPGIMQIGPSAPATNSPAYTNSIGIARVSATGRAFFINNNTYTTGTTVIPLNTWCHVAVARQGTNHRLFVNGVLDTTVTDSTNYTGTYLFAGAAYGSNFPMTGYISNARFVKGTAVYTATFTPPTSPLTAITNTQLLTCQSNRFLDNSTNNFAITVYGDTTVSGFIPFTPNSSYSSYGSTYFDGSNYLSIADNVNLRPGTGDFTYELWWYPTSVAGTIEILSKGVGVQLYTSSGTIYLALSASNSGTYYINASFGTVVTNRWFHVAVSRSGNTYYGFLNGAATTLGTSASSPDTGTDLMSIGAYYTGAYLSTGYISDVRFVKGTAVYTGAFTPPSSPLTAIANTQLLTCQTNTPVNNSVFLDNGTNNLLITRNGDATAGTVSPYGAGWSNYFSGGSDYLSIASNAAVAASADFTIELWAYTSSVAGNPVLYLVNATNGLIVYVTGSKVVIRSYAVADLLTSSLNMPLNQWVHIAASRSGTTLSLWINGSRADGGTVTNSTSFAQAELRIGNNENLTQPFTGYISNVRFVKGTTVYNPSLTTITVPTTPLQPVAGTSLLTCQRPSFVDSSSNNLTVSIGGGAPKVQRFSPFPGTTLPTPYYGAYFDGTGDYLATPSNAAFDISGTNSTVECWFMATSLPAALKTLVASFNGGTGGSFYLGVDASNKINIRTGNDASVVSGTTTIVTNTWYHVVLVRDGATSAKVYLNGALEISNASFSWTASTQACYIGAYAGSGMFTGYISNVRLVKGTVVYTGAFTPSTSPLTAVANTSLLTCQNSTFVDNSTNAWTITANGDSRPTTFNPFSVAYSTKQAYSATVVGGSAYFDGTGDYLTTPTSIGFGFGTGTFTFEAWVYPTSNPANGPGTIIDCRSGTNAEGWVVRLFNNLTVGIYDGPSNAYVNSTGTFTMNAWNHIAIVRSSTSASGVVFYINGIAAGTGTIASNLGTTWVARIGSNYTASYDYFGYISDLRIIKSQALYTSNFVPGNAPLSAVQNTTLLVSGATAGVIDGTGTSNLQTVGDAKISTAVKKYGASSMYFDGNGDYLLSYTPLVGQFGTGDFTIESWVYKSANGTNSYDCIAQLGSASSATDGWYLEISTARGIYFVINNVSVSYGTWTNDSTWHYIAVTRSSGTVRIFLDGTLVASGTISGAVPTTGTVIRVGESYNGTTHYYFNGYIDDFRITKGYARYTANFTAPGAALINK